MTPETSLDLVRPDARGRVRLPDVDQSRGYAIAKLPGGRYMVSPATVVTDFERELRERVPSLSADLAPDADLYELPEGESWGDDE